MYLLLKMYYLKKEKNIFISKTMLIVIKFYPANIN